MPALNEILSLSFKGRASRAAYWRAIAVLSLLAFVGGCLFSAIGGALQGSAAKGLWVLSSVWWLLLFAFLTAVVVRRLHDISYGAVAALFLVIPGVQVIVLVILGLMPGKKGLNRFGPDPLAIMTIKDAVPVRPFAEKMHAETTREVMEGDVVDAGPDRPGTIVKEGLSAEAEDWAAKLIDDVTAKLAHASPDVAARLKSDARAELVAARHAGRLTQSAFIRWVKILEGL